MPVKTGRKLPRARVDAKVAQAAVRLARHVPAAPSTAGSAKVPSTPSQVTLNLTQTPPARPSTEAPSPLNAEVADLLERLAADATPVAAGRESPQDSPHDTPPTRCNILQNSPLAADGPVAEGRN